MSGDSGHIAIVGYAGRFPGAPDVEAFWRNLTGGVESITFFSEAELRATGIPEAVLADPHYVRAKGVLEGADLFDAGYFGITPREAAALDPQQRLFLETAVHALEHAGHGGEPQRLPVGIFGATSLNSYWLAALAADPGRLAGGGFDTVVAVDKDFLCTRAAYLLDLRGPAVTVQTACSSSLVAVHLACQSLTAGECDLALAGGVSISLPLAAGYRWQEGGIAARDGHCRPFAAEAQGTLGGNGVALVALRRLEEALAEGDTIHAVIRGSAVANDGRARAGYGAPGLDGQARVIRAALELAEAEPGSLGYLEAHGTGTPVGDPIEVAALKLAFAGAPAGGCRLGSVKGNIGHLDAAAGVAGLLKATLALEREAIPPSLHLARPNPALGLDGSPFVPAQALAPWPRGERPRRAGVSSFGLGGTNAHVVLEEAPPAPAAGPERSCHLLVLSARSRPALEALSADLARHLREARPRLAEVAWTLQAGRRAHAHRRALVVRNLEEAVAALEGPEGYAEAPSLPGQAPPLPAEATLDPAAFQAALGQLWSAGHRPDWEALWQGFHRRRIPLPLYPFERRRHWFEAAAAGPSDSVTLAVPGWARAPLAPPKAPPRRCLVLADRGGVGEALAAALRAAGAEVESPAPGTAPAMERPEAIFDLRGLDPVTDEAEAATRGFGDLAALAAALPAGLEATLVIATRGLEVLAGETALEPAKASLLGPALTLPQEQPGLRVRTLDLDAGPAESLAAAILAEAQGEEPFRRAALHGGRRWLAEWRAVPLPEAEPPPPGVAVLTGGLGGVGLALAEALAARGWRLLLLSRSGRPAPEAAARLEALGRKTELLVRAADVTDAAALGAALAEGRARLGPLTLAVHAAGLNAGGLLRGRPPEAAAREIAVKAQGARNLAAATAEDPLHRLLLCSALVTVLGGAGQAAYAAGNAVLEAVAEAEALAGRDRVVAVAWDRWRGTGMARAAEALARQRLGSDLPGGLDPAAAAEIALRLIAAPPDRRLALVAGGIEGLRYRTAPAAEAESPAAPASRHPRPPLAAPPLPPRDATEAALLAAWEEAFGLAGLGIEDDFWELGGDSLVSLQLMALIRRRLGVELSPDLVFDHPSVAGMAETLRGREAAATASDESFEEGAI